MERGTDNDYLQRQFGTTEKLDIRIQAHQRYSERPDDFLEWLVDRLQPRGGDLAVDIGCGTGSCHPLLIARGVRAILGVDRSPAMVEATQRRANDLSLPVTAIVANAERLPLPDGAYDLALANHVMFFVEEQLGALREIRRVLKDSGRVVLSTNAEHHAQRLLELHRTAARELGYEPTARVMARFHLGHLGLVRQVFSQAEVFVREDAFLFPTTESALLYYGSGMVEFIADPPADGSHRQRLLARVGESIDEIIRREGAFRVQKDAGCFLARV